jgi:hypothetical protein
MTTYENLFGFFGDKDEVYFNNYDAQNCWKSIFKWLSKRKIKSLVNYPVFLNGVSDQKQED